MRINHDNLNRHIFRLVAPSFLDYLLQAVGATGAMIIISRRLGTDAIAATGAAFVYIFMLQGVAIGIGVGATSLVAQSIGAGETRRAGRYAGQAILLAVLCSIVITAASYVWARPLLAVLGAKGAAYDLAVPFFTLTLWVLPPTFVMFVGMGVIRGYGDTIRPMIVMIIATTVSLYGCLLLVSAHEPVIQGVISVGWSHVAAMAIGFMLTLLMLYGSERRFGASMRDIFAFDTSRLREIIKVGTPAFGEQMVMRAGFFIFNVILMSLGTASFAAHRIASQIESLSFMPGFAFSVAATTIVGQAVGACNLDLAKAATRRSARIAGIVMGSVGVIFFLFPAWLTGFFRPDPEVAKLTTACIRIAAFEQIPLALLFTYAGGLRGAGDTLSPMLVRLIGTTLVRVPGAWLFGIRLGYGITGIWCALVFEWWLGMFVIFYLYRRGRWKRTAIVTKACAADPEPNQALD